MNKKALLLTSSFLIKLSLSACNGHVTLTDSGVSHVAPLNECFLKPGLSNGLYVKYTCNSGGDDIEITEYSDEDCTSESNAAQSIGVATNYVASNIQCETVGACEYIMFYEWDTTSDTQRCGKSQDVVSALNNADTSDYNGATNFNVRWEFSQINGATIDQCVDNGNGGGQTFDPPNSCDTWFDGDATFVAAIDVFTYDTYSGGTCSGLSGQSAIWTQHPLNPSGPYESKCRILYKCSNDAIMTGPTENPTVSPTNNPTTSPTISPTANPTISPTANPTTSPTVSPTKSPTANPTTATPTTSPTSSPTQNPTTAIPTTSPTKSPTANPTISPTDSPTANPTTANPTTSPTSNPTENPTTEDQTNAPTTSPSLNPTTTQTNSPTISPTASSGNDNGNDASNDDGDNAGNDASNDGGNSDGDNTGNGAGNDASNDDGNGDGNESAASTSSYSIIALFIAVYHGVIA